MFFFLQNVLLVGGTSVVNSYLLVAKLSFFLGCKPFIYYIHFVSFTILVCISYSTVGLDIQQKFNMYFSGAKKFGTDNPYDRPYNPTGQRLQHPEVKPEPIYQSAPENRTTTSTDQGTTLMILLLVKYEVVRYSVS